MGWNMTSVHSVLTQVIILAGACHTLVNYKSVSYASYLLKKNFFLLFSLLAADRWPWSLLAVVAVLLACISALIFYVFHKSVKSKFDCLFFFLGLVTVCNSKLKLFHDLLCGIIQKSVLSEEIHAVLSPGVYLPVVFLLL